MANLQSMFVNLAQSYPQVNTLIKYTSALLGILFIVKGIYRFKVYGEMRSMMSQSHEIKIPLMYTLVGTVLLYLPSAQEVLIQTGFGYSQPSPIGYTTDSGWSQDFYSAIIGFVQIIGAIAFIRGWVLLAGTAQQGGGGHGQVGKAWTHIIGGILAINIIGTKDILWTTLGLQ